MRRRIANTALSLRPQARREIPLETSHMSMASALRCVASEPSSTIPNPPLITSPHPTPPPLCSATHVAPRNASPMAFCTAMSAVNLEPSSTLDVSLNGLSVPLTSWWSRLSVTGPLMTPDATAWLNALANLVRPSASLYKMRAWEPTTSLCIPASSTHRLLSAYWRATRSGAVAMISPNTSEAMRSVVARSSSNPEEQTHRNGPKPSEKMSPMILWK
mmetsp:Transcript_67320/g.158797  ORF Transcript_67320/g.158797 Transcript_67320/m.158797 type:complete len:217 (-) Transcript_67320:1572-2222(-)